MSFIPDPLAREYREMFRLAGPLVLAELGWMLQGVVDIMMVGRMQPSATAIGAASIGGMTFYTAAIFFGGLLLGMDPLVANSYGAGRLKDCHRTLIASFYLMVPVTPLLMLGVVGALPLLRGFGIHPAVMAMTAPFLQAVVWSTPPLFVFFVLRHYLQCMDRVKIIMFALVSANLFNLLFNWAFIFGHLGAPAMGIAGSGWATVVSRIYMAVVLVLYTLWLNRSRRLGIFAVSFAPDLERMREIVRLGLPAALQLGLELAVFALAAFFIGRLGPIAIAGHQVALSVVAFTYMVPLGIGAAAAVRVGQALGKNDADSAARAGWVAISLGAAFMTLAAIALWTFPRFIVRTFTADPAVIAAGVSLLFVAAFFQLFDGLQAVATGALRGAGETRVPMLIFLVGYWALGLPLGYYLCFSRGWGARGLWIGLCAALVTVGVVLLAAWRRQVKQFPWSAAAAPSG